MTWLCFALSSPWTRKHFTYMHFLYTGSQNTLKVTCWTLEANDCVLGVLIQQTWCLINQQSRIASCNRKMHSYSLQYIHYRTLSLFTEARLPSENKANKFINLVTSKVCARIAQHGERAQVTQPYHLFSWLLIQPDNSLWLDPWHTKGLTCFNLAYHMSLELTAWTTFDAENH